MAQLYLQLQAKLMRDYYRDFTKYAKGRKPERKVAWVTAFTPVEILEALDIEYIYPESYAAVIAASGKEQDLLRESEKGGLCRDCCAYSGCYNGALSAGTAPRGLPPRPDVLIATNNQCNTLPGWWNLLAQDYDVPLIVLDYPGEGADREQAFSYVTAQHRELIARMEELSGNRLDDGRLERLIQNSRDSVAAWKKVVGLLPEKDIEPTVLFDGISYLITSRCKPETAEFYTAMYEYYAASPEADRGRKPVFWLGYPLWYHPQRYLKELLPDYRVSGSNYVTWWSLDYDGDEPMEQLFTAYNYTFLNLSAETKRRRLQDCIAASGAEAAISLRNKSCKCDFVSARYIGLPQVELEIDMIDREYLDMDRAGELMGILREIL